MSSPTYIPFFLDDLDALEPLCEEERGRLFTALLQYGKTGELAELSGNEKFLFPMFKGRIDRFYKSYQETCERNKNNIKKRYTKSTTVYGGSERTRSLPSEEEEEEEETETKTESKSEAKSNPNTSRASAFDAFWKAYPKKTGKEAARKSFARAKADIGTMLSALEAQKQSEQWTKNNGQFIPNPTTWLNQGRWEDEVQTQSSGFDYNGDFEEGTSL